MLDRLHAAMAGAGLDVLWVSQPENVRYLSGFTSPHDARVLVTPNEALLYTDARYSLQAEQESRLPFHIARGPAVLEHAKGVVGGREVGFEADHLPYAAYSAMVAALETRLKPTSGLVEQLRLVKTAEEIEHLRQAAAVADAALEAVLPRLKAGAIEREVGLDLEFEVRRRGADAAAFEYIVASGARGAMPHGVASDKAIEVGDLVTIDFGAVHGGYRSDMTRTYAVGQPSEELARVYRTVLEAQERAVARVAPGVNCADVDAAAREVITRDGLGEAFTHSTGHGVGLAIHEAPTLSRLSEAVLEAGMVVTVEPGVYLPGLGGVRIEDLVVVTSDGHEVLTRAPKVRL